MGRLPRKKTSTKKKKTTDQNSEATVQGQDNGEGAEKATSGTSTKAVKNRAVVQKKAYTPASKPTAGSGKPKFIDQSIQFLREVKVELKKVTWPTRKQTIGSTIVVIILVMIISVFLGMCDVGLSSLVRVVLQ